MFIVSVLRAATLSYKERLKKPELPSLGDRRRRGTMIEMIKIKKFLLKSNFKRFGNNVHRQDFYNELI